MRDVVAECRERIDKGQQKRHHFGHDTSPGDVMEKASPELAQPEMRLAGQCMHLRCETPQRRRSGRSLTGLSPRQPNWQRHTLPQSRLRFLPGAQDCRNPRRLGAILDLPCPQQECRLEQGAVCIEKWPIIDLARQIGCRDPI